MVRLGAGLSLRPPFLGNSRQGNHPAAVLGRVIRSLRPGGRFSAWVYGRENNGWIVHVVNPLRKRLTSRMRFGDLDALSRVLAGVLYGVCRGLYVPAADRGWDFLRPLLFYRSYFTHLGRFDFDEIHSIVLDHLIPPVAGYYTREEARRFVEAAGLSVLETTWVHENSWAVYGERRSPA